MFYMSEQEKLEQIGALVEELSKLKGHLAHVTEKLVRAQQAYSVVGANFAQLKIADGRIVLATPQRHPGQQLGNPDALLNENQLVEALQERDRLNNEIRVISERLKPLAPHLF
jgi:hypothetical protein